MTDIFMVKETKLDYSFPVSQFKVNASLYRLCGVTLLKKYREKINYC